MKRIYYVYYALAGLIILSGGFLLGRAYGMNVQATVNKQINTQQGQVATQDIVQPENVVRQGCMVEFKTKYEKTGETTSYQRPIEMKLVGKAESDVRKHYTGWTLESFLADRVVLYRVLDAYPEGYAVVRIYTEEDEERTCVYEYDADGQMVLKHTIDDIPYLLEDDQLEILKEGMVFTSIEGAYAHLENLLN
jgi:hypothetical protein